MTPLPVQPSPCPHPLTPCLDVCVSGWVQRAAQLVPADVSLHHVTQGVHVRDREDRSGEEGGLGTEGGEGGPGT